MLVFIFTSCGNKINDKPDSLIESDSQVTPAIESPYQDMPLSGEITVYTCQNGTDIENKANAYMLLNPETIINLVKYRDEDEYIKNLKSNLATGRPDLFETPPSFFIEHANLTYLTDINKMLKNDNLFDINDYYYNVIEAMELEGKLYAFPTHFNLVTAVVNNTINPKLTEKTDEYEGITFYDMVDIYDEFIAVTGGYYLLSPHYIDIAFRYCDDLVDYSNGKVQVNIPNFIDLAASTVNSMKYSQDDYLEMMQRLTSSYVRYYFDYGVNHVTDKELSNHCVFHLSNIMNFQYNFLCDERGAPSFAKMKPFVNTKGEAYVIPLQCYGINSGTKNEELAWDFLKFISQTDESNSAFLSKGLPVYKLNAEKYILNFIKNAIRNPNIFQFGLAYRLIETDDYNTAVSKRIVDSFCEFDMVLLPYYNTWFFFDGSAEKRKAYDLMLEIMIDYQEKVIDINEMISAAEQMNLELMGE